MTEAQMGFLCQIAAALSNSENDETKTILKSYYLMRCKDIAGEYRVPGINFSNKRRCPNCCIEWNKNTAINIKSINLSKRQRLRLKSRKLKESKEKTIQSKQNLLHSNIVEQICSFCKQSTFAPSLKPQKQVIKPENNAENDDNKIIETETPATNNLQKPAKKANSKKKEINVYTNALDAFSLQNKNNALATKEKPKVIKNNKKKKDKFAGLCQKAVLASAKLKEKHEKKDKLSLFLKPSS